jgi:hypothetical protein
MTFIKTGKLSSEDLARQAWQAYAFGLEGNAESAPRGTWEDADPGLRWAWTESCGMLAEEMEAGTFNGKNWADVGKVLGRLLAHYQGQAAPTLTVAEQIALEIVARHLVNCIQANPTNGDEADLDALVQRLEGPRQKLRAMTLASFA